MQLCGKCHKEAPGLREVLQLKCVIILAEVARQLWGSRGHKIARSLAVWKRMDGILQGEREALWKAGVEVVRQVGSFRPQAISLTEWNTIWHQLPCRQSRLQSASVATSSPHSSISVKPYIYCRFVAFGVAAEVTSAGRRS